MNFLALIVSLALQQVLSPDTPLQRDHWFRRWAGWLQALPLPGWFGVAAVLLPPLLLALFLLATIDGWLFGLLELAALVLLLVYALGRVDYHTLFASLRAHCEAGDVEAAWLETSQVLSLPQQPVENAAEAFALIRQALVYEGYQRWFAPVILFVLVGPVAALAYRLLHLLRPISPTPQLDRLLYYVDWLPARALAFSFAVTGDFTAAQRAARASSASLPAGIASYLDAAAGAAVSGAGQDQTCSAQLTALQSLLARSAGGWLLLVSVLYIAF
jgi:AmpE protein